MGTHISLSPDGEDLADTILWHKYNLLLHFSGKMRKLTYVFALWTIMVNISLLKTMLQSYF